MNSKKRPPRLINMIGKLKKAAGISISMRNRLFAFLIVLVATMVLGIVTILLLMGSISAGDGEAEKFVGKELSYITRNVTTLYGDTSVQLVALSESLSKSIEYQLADRYMRVSDLQAHPEVLEGIIGNELNRLQLALEKTKCSGVFMVLDATVNPTLPNAENSRAGLYIRNSEPNVVGPDTTRLYLRGFPGIALQNGLSLQSKWDMEFDVKDCSFYYLPIEKYHETALPLSRLYYWSFEGAIPDLCESVMLCSIPLIDSNGDPFGVCGFEISAMNFMLNYSPDNSVYKHMFCMFSPLDAQGMDAENALYSGHHAAFSTKHDKGPLRFAGGNGLNIYKPENGQTMVGLHEEARLYPSDSAFAEQRFALSLLMPKEELDALKFQQNLRLALICAALLMLGVCVSLFISKKYLTPIMYAFETIRSDNLDDVAKTNILEIDQLIELIQALYTKGKPLPDNLFEDFIARVKTLTPTEMVIFKYYLEGKGNNEILSLMFISLSTLKTHNGHIYAKLNVSSKDELMLYLELIKKSGRLAEII